MSRPCSSHFTATETEPAREQVLVEFMPLVRALASRYAGRGEALEDLVQVGSIGLIKAVDRFDVDRGVDISSYAVPTIVGEIRRHFRDKAWAMHVPRRLKELSVRLSRVLDQLTTELGRSPTIAELAKAVGVEEEDVIDALDSTNAYSTRSLQAPFEDGGDDYLADKLGTDETGFGEVEDGPSSPPASRARRARAADRRAPLLPRDDTVADRSRDRNLADARFPPAYAGLSQRCVAGSKRCPAMSDSVVHLSFPAKPDYLLLARLALSGLARELPLATSCSPTSSSRSPRRVETRYATRTATATATSPCLTVDDRPDPDDRRGPGDGIRHRTRPTSRRAPWAGSIEGGMGMSIIRAIVDELEVSPGRTAAERSCGWGSTSTPAP